MWVNTSIGTWKNTSWPSPEGISILHYQLVIAQIQASDKGNRSCSNISRRWCYRWREEPTKYCRHDSKYLYTSLSTQPNSIDPSIRAGVNIIRYEFERVSVNNIFWIPGSTNPTGHATKKDSALAERLVIMLHSGIIPFHLSKAESWIANRSFTLDGLKGKWYEYFGTTLVQHKTCISFDL